MLFGHHQFDDPTNQGNSFYIKIVYSPDSVDGFGSRIRFFIGGRMSSQGRLDSALRRPWSVARPWRGLVPNDGIPPCCGGDHGDFYGFFMGISRISRSTRNADGYGLLFFSTPVGWWFVWVKPAGMIWCNVNCYRPRTYHSFVGFIPISPKNRWSKRWFSTKSHHFDPFSGFTVPLLWLILTCYSSNILLVLHIFSDFTEGSHSKLGISVIADTSDTVGHMGYNPANITGICQRGHKVIEIKYVF